MCTFEQTRPAPRPRTMSMATKKKNDINARDERGRTKLYLAAETGDVADVARLLESRADVEQVRVEEVNEFFVDCK